jgi:hypothetical protein
MKKILLFAALIASATYSFGQFNLGKALDNAKKDASQDVNSVTGKNGTSGLSNDDVVKGLKEALKVGSNNAGSSASKVDGFFKDSLIKLPFPPDAEKVRKTAVDLGMQKQVDDFVLSINRAAEKAAVKAAPIFVDAITSMSIDDAMNILKGANDAATQYMKNKTSQALHDTFLPIVKQATDSVQVTKYWTPLTKAYNDATILTGGGQVNTDLNEYVTQKALSGIFVLLAQEEYKIRKNPAARVSDILKKVFGSLDSK